MPYMWKKYYLLVAIGILMHSILHAQQNIAEPTQPDAVYSIENFTAHSDTLQRNHFIISHILITGGKKQNLILLKERSLLKQATP